MQVGKKNIGDTVKKGDILAEIETDKATLELESYKEGTLLYQGANAGEKILVNDLLCIIGKQGTDINTIINAVKNEGSKASTNITTPQTSNTTTAEPITTSATVVNEGRIIASPLAKKNSSRKRCRFKIYKR